MFPYVFVCIFFLCLVTSCVHGWLSQAINLASYWQYLVDTTAVYVIYLLHQQHWCKYWESYTLPQYLYRLPSFEKQWYEMMGKSYFGSGFILIYIYFLNLFACLIVQYKLLFFSKNIKKITIFKKVSNQFNEL